jgi:hypothetical protein
MRTLANAVLNPQPTATDKAASELGRLESERQQYLNKLYLAAKMDMCMPIVQVI